ncbi:MAG: SDR family NAD(P)-dependent oxidoreductase [Nitrososphaeria archaeon]|nr:SDR family NAD(P)-dependent oxidoreductase [Aigarchaeota archaeon]MCX8188027.1 SDR family NAD(P)-dependent oxidoreductase [Nitrososphaeria archaeon]
MYGKLRDKVALLTGSSRGIGRSIALASAREGAKVCVNYVHSRQKAEEEVNEIRSMNREAIMIRADVSDKEEVKNLVEEVVKNLVESTSS